MNESTGQAARRETRRALHSTQGSLFWRLWLRALTVKRPQVALAIGSLAVGAAIVSLLVNLYSGANRKMTQDFAAYGANVVISPADPSRKESAGALPSSGAAANLMEADVLPRLKALGIPGMTVVPRLDVVARIENVRSADPGSSDAVRAVAVGTDFRTLSEMYSGWSIQGPQGSARSLGPGLCAVGIHVAARLHVGLGDRVSIEALTFASGQTGEAFTIADIITSGATEDDEVFLALAEAETLAGFKASASGPELTADVGPANAKLSLIELNVPGDGNQIEQVVRKLSRGLAPLEVSPVRQIVESQGKVLGMIRGLVLWLTGLILITIALCVMATMTAIVLERRKDVAVMKSLGASDRMVMRLFLAEGAALGLLGGAAGFLVGALLAEAVARNLFGVGVHPTWSALPLVCAATTLLSLAATFFPVRSVRSVQPATVLKGA